MGWTMISVVTRLLRSLGTRTKLGLLLASVLASLFGKGRNIGFQSGMYKQMRKIASFSPAHQRYLEEIEAPYYDSQNRLREDYLRAHPVIREPLDEDLLAGWSDPGETEMAAGLGSTMASPDDLLYGTPPRPGGGGVPSQRPNL